MYKDYKKNFVMLCDTREQENKHILNYLIKNNINYKEKKLDFGDYSFELEGLSLEEMIVIERKNSIDELCLNFTKERERFKREILRAYEKKAYFILLIENGNLNDIKNHRYRSRMHPNALIGSLNSWKKKYNIYTGFCGKNNTGKVMYNFFKRYVEKIIKNESIAI